MLNRTEIKTLVNEMFHAMASNGPNGERNIDRIMAVFTDDVIYGLPFMDKPMILHGKTEFCDLLAKTEGMFADAAYTVHKIWIDESNQTATIEAESTRKLLFSGEGFHLDYVFVAEFRGNLICALREYAFSPDMDKVTKALDLEQT